MLHTRKYYPLYSSEIYQGFVTGRYLIVFFIYKSKIKPWFWVQEIWIKKKESVMNKNKKLKKTSISKAGSLEEIAEFWDTHSLDNYWDQTHEVEFEVRAKRRPPDYDWTRSLFPGWDTGSYTWHFTWDSDQSLVNWKTKTARGLIYFYCFMRMKTKSFPKADCPDEFVTFFEDHDTDEY